MHELKAVRFVKEHGNRIEQARLDYLLNGQLPPPAIIADFFSSQNQDGSWNPFWAENYGSVDATCFHLAQANQLGIHENHPAISKTFRFIADQQKTDGTWEEGESIAEIAPPWLKPGDISAKLYLTANCGYWLAISKAYPKNVRKAASFLSGQMDQVGHLSSFLQTHWLAGGIWYGIGMTQQAEQVVEYLQTRLDDFSANNLSWMITTLRSVDVASHHPLLTKAVEKLAISQHSDGGWQSDDGPSYDVHTTLEALYALKLCQR